MAKRGEPGAAGDAKRAYGEAVAPAWRAYDEAIDATKRDTGSAALTVILGLAGLVVGALLVASPVWWEVALGTVLVLAWLTALLGELGGHEDRTPRHRRDASHVHVIVVRRNGPAELYDQDAS